MMGPPKSRLSEDDESRGLIPRVLEGVFSRIREVRAGQSAAGAPRTTRLTRGTLCRARRTRTAA